MKLANTNENCNGPEDGIILAAAELTHDRTTVERWIAAAGAVNPKALADSLTDCELVTADIADEASRFLVAATLLRPDLNAPSLGRLADNGLKFNRLAAGLCGELSAAFCRDCPIIGQPCVMAAQFLPGKCAELRAMLDRESQARFNYSQLMVALRGAA